MEFPCVEEFLFLSKTTQGAAKTAKDSKTENTVGGHAPTPCTRRTSEAGRLAGRRAMIGLNRGPAALRLNPSQSAALARRPGGLGLAACRSFPFLI